ncbi:long-chain fatty acid--CoA ligase [Verticiella sediminum]|uniref:Long-chain fatty acid--CoA ligase n=1 Tax=Verticiella sediminum TaxID=1247510 RepID=A0A556B195_9BURK|nr:AMP-binding protein [Verticiella sediminum]TSH98967.1 long-chain fatty acid--CoA ligase [Verticiella sediminum]
MMLTQAVRRAATIRPHGLAIASGGERRTWRVTAGRIAALAGALRTMGAGPGVQVATLAQNSPRHFELLLAAWWAGSVLVPLNTRLAFEEIRYILEHSAARLLVTDEHFAHVAARASDELAGLRDTLVLDDAGYARACAHAPLDDACGELETLAGIFYTGGTTGRPKGVELTHRNFAFAATNMQRDLLHGPASVYLHAAPLFHLADFGIGMGVTMGAGGHSFLAKFSTAAFYERLTSDGVTHLQLVPTMLAAVLDAPERDDRLLAQVRSVSYGAAPVSQALLARLLQAFPHARIQQFYGMTESCGASVMLPAERHTLEGPLAGKLDSVGQPIAGFEIRIAAPGTDQPLEAGQIGEIQVRGATVMRGYWKSPEQTAAALAGGWLRSGDAGRMDEEGFIQVVDRLKDMIISGGENIYCAEVENVLASHPGVAECAVIGLPDDHWGERVHAVVVAREGQAIDAAELDAYCRARIAGYKAPRSYDIRGIPLPLSAVGKVQKNLLREQWLAQRTNA